MDAFLPLKGRQSCRCESSGYLGLMYSCFVEISYGQEKSRGTDGWRQSSDPAERRREDRARSSSTATRFCRAGLSVASDEDAEVDFSDVASVARKLIDSAVDDLDLVELMRGL